jgi:hypothetical protein
MCMKKMLEQVLLVLEMSPKYRFQSLFRGETKAVGTVLGLQGRRPCSPNSDCQKLTVMQLSGWLQKPHSNDLGQILH